MTKWRVKAHSASCRGSILGVLLCLVGTLQQVRATDYMEVPGETFTGDIATCSISESGHTSHCIGVQQAYTAVEPVIIFEGNVTYNFLTTPPPPDKRFNAFTALGGGGIITIKGNLNVTGYGSPTNPATLPQAVFAYAEAQSWTKDNINYYYSKMSVKQDLFVDGGLLVDTYGPAKGQANNSNDYPPRPYDQISTLTLSAKTTMTVSSDSKMFYDNGKAMYLPLITLDDSRVIFDGEVDITLPLLTPVDAAGQSSTYGAMLSSGERSGIFFNGGGHYTVAQLYQPLLSGPTIPSWTGEQSTIEFWPGTYGLVALMGQTNLEGARNGLIVAGPLSGPSLGAAQFEAHNMTFNYTLEGTGPDLWGIIALNSNASAKLINTVMNLTVTGTATSRTGVFMGGMQANPYHVTKFMRPYMVFDDTFILTNVNVNFIAGKITNMLSMATR